MWSASETGFVVLKKGYDWNDEMGVAGGGRGGYRRDGVQSGQDRRRRRREVEEKRDKRRETRGMEERE